MSDVSEAIRRQLMQRCRSRSTRFSQWSHTTPTDWRPLSLAHPRRDKEYFTDDSAWEYIAEALEEGCEIAVATLRKPPGAKGYVILVAGRAPVKRIYIKLQLTHDKVFGRSFHESYE